MFLTPSLSPQGPATTDSRHAAVDRPEAVWREGVTKGSRRLCGAVRAVIGTGLGCAVTVGERLLESRRFVI